jgi:hypothetical protein
LENGKRPAKTLLALPIILVLFPVLEGTGMTEAKRSTTAGREQFWRDNFGSSKPAARASLRSSTSKI